MVAGSSSLHHHAQPQANFYLRESDNSSDDERDITNMKKYFNLRNILNILLRIIYRVILMVS